MEQTTCVIVVSKTGCYIGQIQNSESQILYESKVLYKHELKLPIYHGRGKMSTQRFEYVKKQKLRNFLILICETINKLCSKNDVNNIILASDDNYDKQLIESKLIDTQIIKKFTQTIHIPYTMERGFDYVVEQNGYNEKFRTILTQFFDGIGEDTGKCCYDIKQILDCIEIGNIQDLIVWENIDLVRYTILRDGKETVEYKLSHDNIDGLNIVNRKTFVNWLMSGKFDFTIYFISNRTIAGKLFCVGFDGLGAILKTCITQTNIVPYSCEPTNSTDLISPT